MTTATDSTLDAELIAALRAGGRRVTHPRLLVHRHVRRRAEHLTADQVYGDLAPALPSLSPATVYATLDLLDELGFIRRISTPGATTVYDPNTQAHHHVICRECGRIEDLHARVDTGPPSARPPTAGFRVDHGELQLSGLCRACGPRRRLNCGWVGWW